MSWLDDIADRVLRFYGIDQREPADPSPPRTARPVRPNPRPDGSTYWVYTKEFDVEAPVALLDVLIGKPSDADRAQMRDRWAAAGVDTDASEGWARSRGARPGTENTAMVLLLDHSGSLRNAPLDREAAIAKGFVRAMKALGVPFEVLGHTTLSWKGGRSAEKWRAAGRAPMPGRVCDLLHLVYGDETTLTADDSPVASMFHPNLLRENVDGEALEWALARLRSRPQANKLLLVVSDSAPSDDATTAYNGPGMLHFHLRDVIASVTNVRLVAIDLGPAKSPYPSTVIAGTSGDVQAALLEALDRLFPMPG